MTFTTQQRKKAIATRRANSKARIALAKKYGVPYRDLYPKRVAATARRLGVEVEKLLVGKLPKKAPAAKEIEIPLDAIPDGPTRGGSRRKRAATGGAAPLEPELARVVAQLIVATARTLTRGSS